MTLILPSRHECVGEVASSSRTWTYQSFGSTLASSATPSTKVGGAGLRETVVENWARETTVENMAENSAGNPPASKAAATRPPGVQGLSSCGSIDSLSFAAMTKQDGGLMLRAISCCLEQSCIPRRRPLAGRPGSLAGGRASSALHFSCSRSYKSPHQNH
jgi:hypothetical protein